MQNNPFPKTKEDNPPIVNYPIVETLKLSVPDFFPPINFWDVLKKRRSTRNFKQTSLEEISNVLWVTTKVKNLVVRENGYILSQRPVSSAGARHPIDIIIISVTLNCMDIHYYNPFDHSLNKMNIDKFPLDDFVSHIKSLVRFDEGTIFWFIAHPDRTSAKYENPQSLIWRDAGVLIHSIQIACSALGLNSCPVGSLGEPFVSQGFAAIGDVFGVGGIIIG